MRCFVAVPLTDEIRNKIQCFSDLLGKPKGITKVPAKNLHITLDFLGDISEKEVTRFCRNLDEVASKASPFSVEVCGVGTFSSRGAPKVLWVGLKNPGLLCDLAAKVKAAVDSCDQKKFSPHLTVGRVKYCNSSQESFMKAFLVKEKERFGEMKVDRFFLMKSDLSGKTPVYSVIKEFNLRKVEVNG